MKILLMSDESRPGDMAQHSNDAPAKHFLKLIMNEEGSLESLAERIWKQLDQAGLRDSSLICTKDKNHIHNFVDQTGVKLPAIVDSEQRNTFSTIALASAYLYSMKGVNTDEVITILPMDSYVDVELYMYLRNLEHQLKNSKINMAFVGVKPTYPSTQYAYIIPEESDQNIRMKRINQYIAPQSQAHALHLIEEYALWNTGIISFKLGHMIDLLGKLNLPNNYEELIRQYKKIPMNGLEQEVFKYFGRTITVQYDGLWKKLNMWDDIKKEIVNHSFHKVVESGNSSFQTGADDQERQIIVLGIPEKVSVISKDGILLSDNESVSHKPGHRKAADLEAYEWKASGN